MKTPALFSSQRSSFLSNPFTAVLRNTVVLLFGLFTLAMPVSARADPVTVTNGTLAIDIEGDWFDLRGANFVISAVPGTGFHIPLSFDGLCFPCRAGDNLDLGFQTDGGQQPVGFGPATFGGVTYPELFYTAELNVMAEAQAFPVSTDTLRITQPFVFTGSIHAFTDPVYSILAFSTDLRGRGSADTLFLYAPTLNAHFPEEGRIAYDFAAAQPVPEPATLMMFGSGLCGIAVRRWQRRRKG